MKKLLLLLAVLPAAALSFGQITINSTDMPVPTTSYNIADMSNPAMPPSPIIGTSITWDFGGFNGTSYTEDYLPETDTFFTNVGVDVNYWTTKTMVPGVFFYEMYDELDFNSSAVTNRGAYIAYQGYDISAGTGTADDSVIIPEQKHRFTQPITQIQFPLTNGTSWHTVARCITDFTLTISPFYDHTPSQHVYYVHRDDSVVGWGKMRVYAATGPSAWYDVLMNKIGYYTVDSFYIGGMPADPTLLSTFGMSQGQHSDSFYSYEFYRKGSYNYLAQFNYYNDATYANLGDAYYATDNVDPSSVGNTGAVAYTTLLFPNPAAGNEVCLKATGKVDMANYAITDMSGRMVATGSTTGQLLKADISNLQSGIYVINVFDAASKRVAQEQFTVAH